jgi:3-isopropylmalate dehydrogenase
VTSVHKEPVYRLVDGMFAEECRKMAKNYPDCELDEVLVDGFAMKLVMKPQMFDVVVTTNQFGDILTDEGAGIVGGLGLAPGLVIGDRYAMAQATHGSAPDIAGKNIANPYAMIMSGKMLFEWLGRKKNEPKATLVAKFVDRGMEMMIEDGKSLTGDLGGKASTTQMGDAVVEALRKAAAKFRS